MLSIIVPVYKVEDYLDNCVQSIIHQTFQDWELILVDDGSPDNCQQMCDAYAAQDDRIMVIHQKNGGLSAARNAGLDIARGDFVTFVDSDDDITSETYSENMPFFFDNSNIDIVQYPVFWDYCTPQEHKDNIRPQYFTGEKEIFVAWHNNDLINNSAWNKIYRRSMFESARYPVGRIYEDKFMMLDLLPKIHTLLISDKGCYHYYSREASILRTFNFKRATDWVDSEILVLEQMYRYHELKVEYLPRYMKTVRYLMNAKQQYAEGQIESQLRALQNNRPCNIVLATPKDVFWYLIILILGMNCFSVLYRKLLQKNVDFLWNHNLIHPILMYIL